MSSPTSFIHTSTNVRIEGPFLMADCEDASGRPVPSPPLNLDEFIGNDDGNFEWDGVNFTQSGQNIHLERDVLFADLVKKNGDLHQNQHLDIGRRIQNLDGTLTYVPN